MPVDVQFTLHPLWCDDIVWPICGGRGILELGPEDVSLLERCPHFRGCYVQASMELRSEDGSLLERCPHFRGCYVQASMELGPEDV